jgi:hypothetical protein
VHHVRKWFLVALFHLGSDSPPALARTGVQHAGHGQIHYHGSESRVMPLRGIEFF